MFISVANSIVVSCRRLLGAAYFKKAGLFHVAASLLLTFSSFSVQGAELLTMYRVVLLQPDAVFQERVSSADVLAAYIKSVESVINSSLKHNEQKTPTAGFIVIAIRPGQQSNAWLDFDAPLPDTITSEIVTKIRAIMPVRVKDGPIVFAVKVGLWGGKESPRPLPQPKEWKSVALIDTEEIIDKVWKE
jgi:hypothetical protein